MKKLLFVFASIAVLISVGVANGASKAQNIYYSGVWCKTLKGGAVGCVLQSGKGYGVGISKDAVLVMKDGKTVYAKYQH